MSDLLARRRHGVIRLGLAPVVLVGPPGTGKTRFAQRLSDLLGTPNTVINLAGMSDVKVLKGVTRGWASNRPSRRSEEHTSELQSLMRISYAVFCMKNKKQEKTHIN